MSSEHSEYEAIKGLDESSAQYLELFALDVARDEFFDACDNFVPSSKDSAKQLKATRHDFRDAFRACLGAIEAEDDEALLQTTSGLLISYEQQSCAKLIQLRPGKAYDTYTDTEIRDVVKRQMDEGKSGDALFKYIAGCLDDSLKYVARGAIKRAEAVQKARRVGRLSVWVSSVPLPPQAGDTISGSTYVFRIEPALKEIHRPDFIPGANINYTTEHATHGDITVPPVVTALLGTEEATDAAAEHIHSTLYGHLGSIGYTGFDMFWVANEA